MIRCGFFVSFTGIVTLQLASGGRMKTQAIFIVRRGFALLSCCTLFLVTGCQSGPQPLQGLPDRPVISVVLLNPGDEIEIKFAYAEQFNERQVIRPDGKIELQLVGEVAAAGKTPSELREQLKKQYADHLKHPQLAVIVRSINEQRVYVGGQVNEPGSLALTNQMTALEAIMEAGGFDIKHAKTANIVVIRHNNDTRHGYLVNLKTALAGQGGEAFYLEPRDIVFVPRTTITRLNDWMDQYSNKMVPDVGLTFTRSLGRTQFGYETNDR